MSSVYVLVGPIASGKSTYAKEMAQNGAIIVSDDSIVNALHGGFNTLYNKEFKPLYKSIENQIVSTAILMGLNVVIDRPNLTRLSRSRWVSIAKSLDASPVAVFFEFENDPMVHAQRRFAGDSRGWGLDKWIKVANRQFREMEGISPVAEGFDLSFIACNKHD